MKKLQSLKKIIKLNIDIFKYGKCCGCNESFARSKNFTKENHIKSCIALGIKLDPFRRTIQYHNLRKGRKICRKCKQRIWPELKKMHRCKRRYHIKRRNLSDWKCVCKYCDKLLRKPRSHMCKWENFLTERHVRDYQKALKIQIEDVSKYMQAYNRINKEKEEEENEKMLIHWFQADDECLQDFAKKYHINVEETPTINKSVKSSSNWRGPPWKELPFYLKREIEKNLNNG